MHPEDGNKKGLRWPFSKKRYESVKIQVTELSSPSNDSLSVVKRPASHINSERHTVDDLINLLAQTRLELKSPEYQEHSTARATQYTDAIDRVTHEVLTPSLKVSGSERLLPTHPCFEFSRKFAKKWGISDEAVQSHIKLACGYLNFPVILLLNPAPKHEDLPFDEMVEGCRTLKWIQDVLYGIGLELADVIILDACTLLSNDYIRDLEREGKKNKALSEAYDVTQKMLQMIKPDVIISCQCSTNFSQWCPGGHIVAEDLCSSIKSAKRREVRKVDIGRRTVNVVQAYHPSGFLNRKGHHDPFGNSLKTLLGSLYKPCASWKSQHIMALRASVNSYTETSKTTRSSRISERTVNSRRLQ